MEYITIFGIKISIIKKAELLKKIQEYLNGNKCNFIITANPEILLRAHKDEEYWFVLNQSDITIADGTGIKLAGFSIGKNIERITGADLINDILKIANEKKLKIGVINLKDSLSSNDDIERAVNNIYPDLNVEIKTIDRPRIMGEGNHTEDYKKIMPENFAADIMLVALGAPHQEKLIYHAMRDREDIKLAIGIGGSFDFLTKKIKRAPKIFRAIGLEWLWRLLSQPERRIQRLKRILNAVFIFPWKFFQAHFIHPYLYRSNVACLLYKKENDKYKIFITQRRDQENHWQLPQGGTDGEDLKAAGSRELREEVGTDKFRVIDTIKNIHKYDFKGELCKYGIQAKSAEGYKGQKQGLCIAEFIGEDSDININFWEHKAWKWVDSEDLVEAVYPSRKEATEKFLIEFNKIIKQN